MSTVEPPAAVLRLSHLALLRGLVPANTNVLSERSCSLLLHQCGASHLCFSSSSFSGYGRGPCHICRSRGSRRVGSLHKILSGRLHVALFCDIYSSFLSPLTLFSPVSPRSPLSLLSLCIANSHVLLPVPNSQWKKFWTVLQSNDKLYFYKSQKTHIPVSTNGDERV